MFNLNDEFSEKNLNRKTIFLLTLPTLFLSLILMGTIFFLFRFLPPNLPLFYSMPWGDLQLVGHQQFYIIPASITLITLINLIICLQLHPAQSFFKKILMFSSLITALILLISFFKIVFIFI